MYHCLEIKLIYLKIRCLKVKKLRTIRNNSSNLTSQYDESDVDKLRTILTDLRKHIQVVDYDVVKKKLHDTSAPKVTCIEGKHNYQAQLDTNKKN